MVLRLPNVHGQECDPHIRVLSIFTCAAGLRRLAEDGGFEPLAWLLAGSPRLDFFGWEACDLVAERCTKGLPCRKTCRCSSSARP